MATNKLTSIKREFHWRMWYEMELILFISLNIFMASAMIFAYMRIRVDPLMLNLPPGRHQSVRGKTKKKSNLDKKWFCVLFLAPSDHHLSPFYSLASRLIDVENCGPPHFGARHTIFYSCHCAKGNFPNFIQIRLLLHCLSQIANYTHHWVRLHGWEEFFPLTAVAMRTI